MNLASEAGARDAAKGGRGLIPVKAFSSAHGPVGAMRVLLFLAALLCLAAGPALAERADLQRGEILVRRHCAACHAVGSAGDSPFPAAPPFRELHRRYRIDDLAEALAEGILTGHPAMPEFQFPPADVQAIIAYLKSIQTRQDASLPVAGAR